MTAPVTPLPQAGRPGRAQDRPDPAAAAGFASALDGVLSARREPPGQSAERVAERLEKAAGRAADQTERAAARLEKATERAAEQTERAATRAASSGDGDGDPADGTEDAAAAQAPAGAEAAPGRTGLPAAIWALLTGTAAPAPGAPTVVPPTAGATDVPAAVPIVGGPAADPVAVLPTGDVGVPMAPAAAPAPAVAMSAVPSPAPTQVPTAVPATVDTGDAAALAGLTVVVEPAGGGAAATAEAAAPADPAAPSATNPAADTEAGVPAPAAGTAPHDQATPDDAGGAPSQTAAVAPTADGGDIALPVPMQVAGTAPVTTTTAPAAPVAGPTDPGTAQPVGGQVARQVAVLRGAADGSHTMTLVLTPETLGPVEVQVTVSKGSLDLMLRGAHEHGRAALLDALPDLRRDLEQAGLSVTSAQVDRDTGGSRLSDRSAQYADRQQGFGDRGGQDRGDSRSRPWPGAADTTGGPTPPHQRTTSSGLDVRA